MKKGFARKCLVIGIAFVMTAGLSACGNAVSESGRVLNREGSQLAENEIPSEQEAEPEVTSEPTVTPEPTTASIPTPTPSPAVEPEESMESSEVEDNSEIISMDDTVMYAIAKCNIRSGAGTQYDKVGSLSYAQEVTINGKVEAGEGKLWYVIKTEDGSTQMVSASMLSETKPAAQTSSVNGSGSSSNSGGSTGATGNSETEKPAQTEQTAPEQTAPAASESVQSTPEVSEPASAQTASAASEPAPTPVHEHTWKGHIATTQTWVPNIVVVEDYPPFPNYREVGSRYICHCGFDTTDPDAIIQHSRDNPVNWDEFDTTTEFHNFTIWPVYEEYWEPISSHEEDQGHYETSTYVDYYYCDCGATK